MYSQPDMSPAGLYKKYVDIQKVQEQILERLDRIERMLELDDTNQVLLDELRGASRLASQITGK